MKTTFIIILAIVAIVGIGYFGIPILIEKQTAVLKSDIQDLKQRLQKIEEESKAAPLKPDADIQKVIKTVNTVYHTVTSLEASLKKDFSVANETIQKQGKATEEALKKQADAIDKISKEIEAKIQRIKFDAAMASIRGHVLKAKLDLESKNIGTSKNELTLIEEQFEKVKTSASDENKKIIGELQLTLKKAKADIDNDLPAAINRIELLWHELDKMLRKV